MKSLNLQKVTIGILSFLTIGLVVTLILVLVYGNPSQTLPPQSQIATPIPQAIPATSAAPVANPAQIITPTASRSISVSAIGQVQATPDMVTLSVGADIQAPTARQALEKAQNINSTIIKSLVDMGIAEKDIQTQGVYTYPEYSPSKDGTQPADPKSYRANLNVSIIISDVSKAGTVLDATTKAGANRVGGLTFGLKDDKTYRQQALEQAVQQAKPKAEAMARGLNLQVGQVLTVTEDMGSYASYSGGGKGGGDGIAPGQLTVGVRVIVVFAVS